MALAHAILACLMDSDCTGYDLAKQFNGSVSLFWQATHQQIYQELSNLETLCWVDSQTIPQAGRPDKKLYHITELGRKQLIEWVKKPCKPPSTKDELLLKIRLGTLVERQVILEELERHRQIHLKKLSVYQDLKHQRFQNPQALPLKAQLRYLALLRGIGYETEWLAWCTQAVQVLGAEAATN